MAIGIFVAIVSVFFIKQNNNNIAYAEHIENQQETSNFFKKLEAYAEKVV